jgi:hypothetical protein
MARPVNGQCAPGGEKMFECAPRDRKGGTISQAIMGLARGRKVYRCLAILVRRGFVRFRPEVG